MAICYGGMPQLEPLIREQREREALDLKEPSTEATFWTQNDLSVNPADDYGDQLLNQSSILPANETEQENEEE